jgi:DNA-binding NarL/FixJ family response regulator
MKITVIVADDHALVREGVKAVLEKTTSGISVIAEASNGRELLALKIVADVYLLDISMPLMNGIEVLRRLRRRNASCRVIMVSMHDDRPSVERALHCGAAGYLVKEAAMEEVVEAVKKVYSGGRFLSARVGRYIVDEFTGSRSQYAKTRKFETLTAKEKEVLQLVAEGFSGRLIASQLKMALSTVHVHRKNIMRKLDIHKQADLVRYAIKEGITRL